MDYIPKLREVLQRKQEEYIDFFKGLISCDTQVKGHGIAGGNEKNGQEYLEKILVKMGADIAKDLLHEKIIQEAIERYGEGNPGHDYSQRYNLIADFKGTNQGKTLMFNGHVDTMPPGDLDLWNTDPFTPVIKDGKLYGLGAADMKSGLMAAIMAVKLLQDAGIHLPCIVKIASVVDEEGGGNGTIALAMRGHRADAAVVCEPSDNSLIVAHMGFVFFEVEVSGVALHGGQKWDGVNTIEKAIVLIEALHQLEHEWLMRYKNPLLPPPTLNIGVIEGGKAGSTVPDRCIFKFVVHYLPEVMSRKSVEEEVINTLILRSQGDSYLKDNLPRISVYQAGNAFQMDADHPLVAVAQEAMGDVLGREPVLKGGSAGNDARILKNIAHIPTIVMGPGYLEQCHSPNEYVRVEDYLNFILIYANFILKWAYSAQ